MLAIQTLARTFSIFIVLAHSRSLCLLELLIKFEANITEQNYCSCLLEKKKLSQKDSFKTSEPANHICVSANKHISFGGYFAAHRHVPLRGSASMIVTAGFKIEFKTIIQLRAFCMKCLIEV